MNAPSRTEPITLADFLLACIADDERKAERAGRGVGLHWTALDVDGYVRGEGSSVLLAEEEDHILEHDPARVLAECWVKREIIRVHREAVHSVGMCRDCMDEMPCLTLRLLTLPYRDRPGYRQEWTP